MHFLYVKDRDAQDNNLKAGYRISGGPDTGNSTGYLIFAQISGQNYFHGI
jgi:hypothetical protein